MGSIELRDVAKIYPFVETGGLLGRRQRIEQLARQKAMPYVTNEGVIVLQHIDLTIRDGEFLVLLGPSGCGKTTLLRMIAGFNSIEGGDFYFNEERINDKEPSKRNIGMVFQNYAIFPHMTVAKNVAYGLKNRKTPKDEIARETDRFLEIMQIKQYADRLPENLSGGQQQRVALARALVIKPDVLLMDEPLSNLDAKLRLEMRQAIRKIQREVGITTVYVTHDQEEAMSISDTIAVMNAGKIQHIGTPRDIYQRPANTFVATFIGRTNILDARMEQGTLVFPTGERFTRDSWRTIPDGPVKVSVRPEEFVVHHADEKAGGLSAVLEDSVYLGLNTHYYLKLTGGASVELIQESAIDEKLEPGSAVTLTLKEEKINIFSEDGTKNYLRG